MPEQPPPPAVEPPPAGHSSVRVRTYLRPAAALSLAAILLTGCRSAAPAEPDTVVVLIDKSASTTGPKNAAYADYLKRYVLPALTPGTRVIIEPIAGANTHSDPALRVVTTLPSVTRLTKNTTYYLLKGDMSVDKKCLAAATSDLQQFNAARADLAAEAQRILRAHESSPSTFLLDGMKEASESLEQRTGRGLLIVLSDGLEDSNTDGQRLDFNEETFWSRHAPATFARTLDPAHTAPGLKGATVYLVGLAAASGPVYSNVRDFWKDFFDAAHTQRALIGHQPIYEEKPFTPTPHDLCR